MITTTLRRAALVALATLAPLTLSAQSESFTFDGVPLAANGLQNNFTSLGAYQFYNFNVANTTFAGTSANAVSGSQFGLGRFDQSGFYKEAGKFNFSSAWLSFLQFDAGTVPDNSPVDVIVFGYRAGDIDPTYTRTISLTSSAQQFSFGFNDIEEVSFDTQALVSNGRNVALAMDNAAMVPETASLVLLVLGATGLMLVQVRRKNSNA